MDDLTRLDEIKKRQGKCHDFNGMDNCASDSLGPWSLSDMEWLISTVESLMIKGSMQIKINVYTKLGDPFMSPFANRFRAGMVVVKAICYPNGKLYLIYRLDFATGEWVTKRQDDSWPPNTIYGQELFDRLNSKICEPAG